MPANIYSIIEEKGFKDGIVFIATRENSIIEVHVYGGIIINFKCLRLSSDQIYDALLSGDFKEITFQKFEVNPETARAELVVRTFPAAVAVSAINPARTEPSRLLRIIRLMSSLVGSDKDNGVKAFDIMFRQISALYQGFLPDISTLKDRIGRISNEFGIRTTFLDGKPLPADIYSVPEWIFSNFETIGNNVIKEVIVYYIFFGEKLPKLIRTTIEKEAGLAAKQGYAGLSKAIYPDVKSGSNAILFKGAEKAGEIKINLHKEKKKTIGLTKSDLDVFGLSSGDTINLILED